MAIRVRCPRCWETAEVSEEARGKQGVCNSCGASVMVPTRLTKVCFICGGDVTRTRHAKDPDNNYLCLDCWAARNASQRAIFSDISLECSICGAQFAPGEGFERGGRPICKDCHEKSPVEGADRSILEDEEKPTARRTGASDRGRNGAVIQRGGGRLTTVLAVAALVAAGLLAVAHFTHRGWEDEHGPRIIALRAQIETLLSAGKSGDAVRKYNELSALLGDRTIKSRFLREEIRSARIAGELASQQENADTWEERYTAKLLMLKAQGDVLVTVGKAAEAIEKYNELFRLVQGRTIRGEVLGQELMAARRSLKEAYEMERKSRASAVLFPSSRPAEAPVRPPSTPANPPSTEPAVAPQPKTNRTIFDD